jgi:membrane-bound metal-dependent hydrolase YbcI (DUF457 family)
MPLAVTHVLTSIILVDLYRDYFAKKHKNGKYFSLHTILIAGIGGLMPDIDVPLNWVLGLFGHSSELLQHGGITHTPFFALLFLIPGIVLWKKDKRKLAVYFYVIMFGILLHIFLDYLIGGGAYEGIMWLFPLSRQAWKIHILSFFNIANIPEAIDAVILVLWLWHEEVKHKIADFI